MNEQQGTVLVISMLVMAVLAVLGLAFLMTARTEDTIASNYRNHTAAFYAAEAGLESGVSSLKTLLRANPTPSGADLAKLAAPALTDPSYTFDAFQVARVRTALPYEYRTTLSGGAYNGLFADTTDYIITATVRGPRGSRAQLSQKVQYVGIPLFQFGIFHGKDKPLQLFPGPKMTFTGRIHANDNIHLGTMYGLQIDSYVTSTGNIYRHSMSDPTYRGKGTVQIKDASGTYQTLNFDHEYDYDFTNPWAETDWKTAALSTFGGQVQDSAMGVQEIIPPIPDALYDPNDAPTSSHLMIEKGDSSDTPDLKAAKMQYKAGLIIDGKKAFDQAGNKVDINKCKDTKGKKAVRTEKFYDGDNGTDMEVTQIDVGALTACGVMPENGILYAT
ncbi:MAG: PilX N-terminal domain-containing pilus assembly protein, partial [Nitrospinota bacterium]